MSEQNVHYETLGLTEESSFEEVQAARKRLVAEHEDDPKKKEGVEAAYDAILMERLRLRQEGKIKVPDRIRFAEKQTKPKVAATAASGALGSTNQWFSELLDQPEDKSELLWPSVIFGGLACLSWVLMSPDALGASFCLGLGMMSSVFFLNQKTRKLWRSMGLSVAGLAVGFIVGLALGAAISSGQGSQMPPDQMSSLAATVTLIMLWFVTSYLR